MMSSALGSPASYCVYPTTIYSLPTLSPYHSFLAPSALPILTLPPTYHPLPAPSRIPSTQPTWYRSSTRL